MLQYRITKESAMVKGDGFEQSYTITNRGMSEYPTWINEPTWERGIPFISQDDIFGRLGCTKIGQREIHRWAMFHTSRML